MPSQEVRWKSATGRYFSTELEAKVDEALEAVQVEVRKRDGFWKTSVSFFSPEVNASIDFLNRHRLSSAMRNLLAVFEEIEEHFKNQKKGEDDMKLLAGLPVLLIAFVSAAEEGMSTIRFAYTGDVEVAAFRLVVLSKAGAEVASETFQAPPPESGGIRKQDSSFKTSLPGGKYDVGLYAISTMGRSSDISNLLEIEIPDKPNAPEAKCFTIRIVGNEGEIKSVPCN